MLLGCPEAAAAYRTSHRGPEATPWRRLARPLLPARWSPGPGPHSVTGGPSENGLAFAEYVTYREQVYPEYLITFQIVRPEGVADG